jgi:hypothetical protein
MIVKYKYQQDFIAVTRCTDIATTRFKAWVYGRELAGIVGSNPAGGMDVCLSVSSVVCCQVEVFATG